MERAEGDLAQLLARLVASKGLVQKPAVLGMTHQLLAGLADPRLLLPQGC